MSCFLEFFVRLFISFSVYIFQFSIRSEKASNCSAVTGWISGKRIWNTLRLGGDQLEGWWVPHLWVERVCSGPRAHQSCRWTWRVDLTTPPCHTHTHLPILLVLRDFTQVCQFRWMRRRDWCLLSSCYDPCTLMMQNEKLSHQEVEVSRKSNQTKAKVVRCQHPEVPFQRDFPRLFKVGLSFLPLNWLYWVFVAAPGLSRVAASRGGQLLVGVCRLLTAAASPVVQHGF